MNINPLNIAKSSEFSRHNTFLANKHEKKSSNEISTALTEKFNPEESNLNSANIAVKTFAQHKPTSPIVKTINSSKNNFEDINYEDTLERVYSEEQDKEILLKGSSNSPPQIKKENEIGTGFYLTIEKNDLERLSNYDKVLRNNLERYGDGYKPKNGILVNLTF